MSRALSLAGFQVTLIGRFWVTTEVMAPDWSLCLRQTPWVWYVAVDGLIPPRRLNERDYLEFTINGKNKPQKIGNVTVELKGVNQKRNQYSVAMTVEPNIESRNR